MKSALFFTLFSFISASPEIALYWGQNSAGDEQTLASYCQNSPGDTYIISFINGFGNGGPISMNIHGYYNYISGTSLLDASGLGPQIQTCQNLGKKVLISLGGAIGNYGLNSDAEAESVAADLWNYFGGGSSSTRPFGSGVKLDGFDFDIENKLDSAEYVTLANKLNELFATDNSKQYYLSASPQCPFPDASVGDAISRAHFDYLFVQFYNNYCSASDSSFNLDTWQKFASSSPNPNVKLLVGLAGGSTAGSGYATIDEVKQKYFQMNSAANFGGFMLWDASQANSNIIDGESYVQHLEDLLKPKSSSTTSTEASSTSTEAFSTSTEASSTSAELSAAVETTSGFSAGTAPVSVPTEGSNSTAEETILTSKDIYNSNSTKGLYITSEYVTVVDTLTVPCSGPTEITTNGATYTATEATTLTITDCPCTRTIKTSQLATAEIGSSGSPSSELLKGYSATTSNAAQSTENYEFSASIPIATSESSFVGGFANSTTSQSAGDAANTQAPTLAAPSLAGSSEQSAVLANAAPKAVISIFAVVLGTLLCTL